MSEIIDHISKVDERIVTQFKSSIKLISYIKTLLLEANTLEEVYRDLIDSRWIDTAEGAQLDILGAIVDQSRIFIDAEIFEYFGFDNHPQAQSFGSILDPTIGGRFIEIGEPITGFRTLSDDEYRVFIKAKIIRNKTKSRPEEIISQLKFLFPASQIVFADNNTFYEVSIGRKLSLNEKSVLFDTDIIPKTAGVGVSYVTEYDYDSFFSFQGVPNSQGFGSVNNSSLGGTFGNLI